MSAYQLDILVPSRGRPASIARLWRAIQDTATHPERIRLRVRLDDDDPPDYPELPVIYTRGPRIRLAASWNEQARQAADDGATHLALWGDDNIPITQGWDRLLVERLDRDGPGFAYGRDGIWDGSYDTTIPRQLALPTACIMPIEVHRALGYVSPPGIVHLCIDVAWRDLGLACDALFYESGVMIRHFHRVAGAPDDQTYRDANDNREQHRGDNIAVTAWKVSADFERARAELSASRLAWQTEKALSS